MPNTKTKKFDWQIFLAVFCILLVIACATFCCVISNDDKCVARAEESTTSSFTVDDGFYIKNYSGATSDEIEELINYFSSFIYGLMNPTADFETSYNIGFVNISYTNNNQEVVSQNFPLRISVFQTSSDGLLAMALQVVGNSIDEPANLVFVYYMYTQSTLLLYSGFNPYTQSNSNYFYYDITSPVSSSGTFVNAFVPMVFGETNDVSSIESLTFTYLDTANIGILISPSDTFVNISDLGDDSQAEINRLTGIIQEQRQEIQYYESLNLNQSQIPIFNIARCSPSTFEYNGVTYTSDTIERTSSGWDIYHSSYLNQELPENYGVGFSLFLVETLSNTKFDMSPLIDCWYNYTYDGAIANTKYLDFSVGYRNQNGNIVKVGSFDTGPGMSDGEFIINAPTNELVFFREDSNLMEVDNDFSIVRYQYDTESIYNDGYDAGIRFGMQLGRQEGYNQGVLDANDYSFFSLFTSVFDAPITAIVGKWGDSDGDGVYQREGGMLNFYIPGLDINFAPFLLSLFTIGIIVLIIRFILARKS